MTGFPIEIASGSKIFQRTDFETTDGGLVLGRWFTSGGYGGVSATYYSSRDPIAFANWRASFAVQLTLSDFTYGHELLLLPSGRALSFTRQSDGSFTADSYTSSTLPATDVKLAFVGTWPSSSSAMQAAPATWTVTDEDDNVWTLQTHLDPELGTYSIAAPVSMVDRNGLVRTFTYGTLGELAAMSDSAGKAITFVWIYSDPSSVGVTGQAKYPVAISEADLPDGSKIRYYYTSLGQSTTGLRPDVLNKVEYRDANNVVQDSETYNYGDSRFPWFVTDILDKNGVTRWLVTYDSAGRAITSQAPGGAFATSIGYTSYGYTFTRTVTNALGKQAIYQFANAGGWGDSKLTGVNGQASANCVASNSSYTYDANNALTSSTDEEGRVVSFTRNARGLPTQIVEAQGASVARTTNITWHSTLTVPTQVVEPGRTTTYNFSSGGSGSSGGSLPPPSGGDPNTAHSYWRVRVADANGGSGATISNLYLFSQAGGDDLATGGTAISSASATGGPASQAFDRDPTTDWSGTDSTGAWVGYQFASPVVVRFIGLVATASSGSLGATPADFSVQYSDDGANWGTLWNVTGQGSWTTREVRYFTGPGFSYTGSLHGSRSKWRVRLISSNSNAFSATEVQFRATPGGSNQASGGTPFATQNYNCSSSSGCSYSADKAFDGSTSTLWSSTTAAVDQVLQYTFASSVSVGEVAWTARSDGFQGQSPTAGEVEYWNQTEQAWISAWNLRTTAFSSGQTQAFTDPNYIAP